MGRKCLKVDPSAMDKRITFEQVAETPDGGGGFTNAWSTVATVWASVKPISGREKFQAEQMETPIAHKVICRYRSDITTKNRFTYDGRTFNILDVIDLEERKAFLKIMADSGTAT